MDKRDYNMDGESVRVLAAIAQVANDQYNDYINDVLKNGDDWDIPHLIWLRERANTADVRLENARYNALNECTCRPDSDIACPVCIADARRRYRDEIPY